MIHVHLAPRCNVSALMQVGSSASFLNFKILLRYLTYFLLRIVQC